MKKPPSTYILRPIIPINTRSPRITAAAGTRLARSYSLVTVIILTNKRTLQLKQPSSFTLYC